MGKPIKLNTTYDLDIWIELNEDKKHPAMEEAKYMQSIFRGMKCLLHKHTLEEKLSSIFDAMEDTLKDGYKAYFNESNYLQAKKLFIKEYSEKFRENLPKSIADLFEFDEDGYSLCPFDEEIWRKIKRLMKELESDINRHA